MLLDWKDSVYIHVKHTEHLNTVTRQSPWCILEAWHMHSRAMLVAVMMYVMSSVFLYDQNH